MPDIINGLFELVGSLAIWSNVRALLRDKEVRGIDWRVTLFFTSWGFWNLYYYPHLGQWASFFGGIGIVAANVVWITLVLYYLRK